MKNLSLLFSMLLLLGITVVSSCKKEDTIGAAPTITTGNSVSALAGAVVKITATINAPNGIKTLQVLKNGVNFDAKSYATGTTTDNYSKDYTIENLAANSVVNFTFIVTDYKDLTTTAGPQTITVSSVPTKQIVAVEGTLEGNIIWTSDKIYKLKGFVRVGEDKTKDGTPTKTGVLTIQPGTVIVGERATKGTLIVQRGSKIIAEGTATAPIVFTSERGVGEREPGDWGGGLVLCGRAKNNLPGGVGELEGQYGAFHGGTDNADNSGILKYVRIEYAGVPINPNQEVNSLTLGSVGNGTTIEYVQATYGLDDSFEWFGGTVNAKYLIAYKGLDDDFDVDNGHSGFVQYAVGIRGATQADQSGSNGFEVDNDGTGSDSAPFTSSIFSNVTIIGPKAAAETSISPQFQNGAHLRRNAKIKIYNAIITAYPNGIYIDGANTSANAQNKDLILKNVIVAGVDKWGTGGFGEGTSVLPRGFSIRDVNTASTAVDLPTIGGKKPSEWFVSIAGNKVLKSYISTGLSSSLWLAGRPSFAVAAGSDALTSGGTTDGLPAFFTANTHIGAFGATDWTANWAEFSPSTKDYSK